LPLVGGWFGGSLVYRDTVLLGKMRGLGLEKLGAEVANFVVGVTTLSGLSGELLALACDMPFPIYRIYVPDFQVGVRGKESLVVGWAPESLFSLCLY
jgi:hypothetical protein